MQEPRSECHLKFHTLGPGLPHPSLVPGMWDDPSLCGGDCGELMGPNVEFINPGDVSNVHRGTWRLLEQLAPLCQVDFRMHLFQTYLPSEELNSNSNELYLAGVTMTG